MKNLKMVAKLLLVGTLIILIPLAAVAVLSVSRATAGLSAVEGEQLTARANLLAQVIDRTFREEIKVAQVAAHDPAYVAVCTEVAAKKSAAKAAEEVDLATEGLQRFMDTPGAAADYIVAFIAGADGTVIATSSGAYLGISIAQEPYFQTAMAGSANTGAAAHDMVTTNPFVPVAVPITSSTGAVVGVSVLYLGISFVNDLVKGEKIGKNGFAFVSDGAGLVVAHPKDQNILSLNVTQVKG
ncbi:MAG TPA: cache domain-containing protein, partial [Spirochaetia bacterium]